METLGERIRKLRTDNEKTMRELAKELTCSPMFISDIENGKRIPINSEVLKRMANLFNVDYQELHDTAMLTKASQDVKKNPNMAKIALARKLIESDINESEIKKISDILVKRRTS